MDAPEKLRFGGKPHAVRPKDPQGAARELFLISFSRSLINLASSDEAYIHI